MILRVEVIGGQSYELHQVDGERFYKPPLPESEVAKRASRETVFAQELQSRQVARGSTDATYLEGMPHFSEVFGEEYANEVRAVWDREGVPYTSRTNYCPHLAEYKGDRRAIVDGKGAAKRRQEMLSQPVLSDPLENAPPLSDSLIAESASQFALDNPEEVRKMDATELKDHMIDKHGLKT